MKIAQIDSNYGSGSTGKLVKKIHKFLLLNQHQSTVFYGRGDSVNEVGVLKICSDAEVYINVGLSRLTGYTGIFSNLATKKLIHQLKIFKPDVVHLHELHGYYINQYKLLEYLSSENIPIVWTLHCENAYTGRCGYAFDCDQWKVECVKCPSLNDYPKSFFFDRSRIQFNQKKNLLNKINLINFVPVSHWLHSRVKQSFLSEKEASVIHNGIDVENIFYPRDFDELKKVHNIQDELVFLAVAPDLMSSRKGGEWIIKVAMKFEAAPIKFIMIGVSSTRPKSPKNVIFLEAINDQDLLAKYYSLADAFLITSQRETFSLTTVEALACGTPVIGFDSGGPLEVAPKPYGNFVQFGDIHGLVQLISDFVSDKSSLPKSEECVAYARKFYSDDLMCQNYEKIYNKILRLKATL